MTPIPDASAPATLWLSCHVDYACQHSGACCRSGWPLPVEQAVVASIDEAVARGKVWTIDGRVNWLDVSPVAPPGIAGSFRQVEGGCVFHKPLAFGSRSREARHCAVHGVLGATALPSSCQHFPRVCLIDDRGVRVSLSHYCPTAAAMLVDHDAPLSIVAGPAAVPAGHTPEGLDVTGELPPRLTARVLADLDAVTLWEKHVVATLAGLSAHESPEHALAQVILDARRLAQWQPQQDQTLSAAVASLPSQADAAAIERQARALMAPASWLPRFALALESCATTAPIDAPPETLAQCDARYVWPGWTAHGGTVRRYLAAKAFGSWVGYQADVAVGLAEWLTVCHAVLRIELARACAAAGRPLDRALLIGAIRQADLLLVHHGDALRMASALGDHDGARAAAMAIA